MISTPRRSFLTNISDKFLICGLPTLVVFIVIGLFAVSSTFASISNDIEVSADYDGDSQIDQAYWRPETGLWYVLTAASDGDISKVITFKWGNPDDIPVQADYDGDKRADFAVFRPGENSWYIRFSKTNDWRVFVFGSDEIKFLLPADYTGDGNADLATYSDGVWNIYDCTNGKTERLDFGFEGAEPIPGYFDDDQKLDFAVVSDGKYFIFDGSGDGIRTANFKNRAELPKNLVNVKLNKTF